VAMFMGSRLDALLRWMEHTGWHALWRLVGVALTCLALLWAVRIATRAVRRAVAESSNGVATDAERRAATLGAVLNNTFRVLVVAFFLLAALREVGVDIGPLVAGAGIAGLALGFGAQSLVKDVISGFFMLVENQFSVGDIVNVDDKHVGTVERMTLRITRIRDMEGRAHYLPNGSIVRVIVLSKEFANALVDVEVSIQEDMDRVMAILRGVGEELLLALPDWVLEPTEVKGIEVMTPTGCTIRTFTKTAPGAQWAVARELRRRILLRFRAEGITMPLPQRVVWTRNYDPAVGGED
jgi:moderate conductance mechanosensitive channel